MRIALESSMVSASILLDGGILWEPSFRLANGRWVMPLAKAPWADDTSATAKGDPAYIRRLGGAFLGLPFGGRAIDAVVGNWSIAQGEAPLHGRCATAIWRVIDQQADRATITLDFLDDTAVVSVEQTFVCAADAARIDVAITIYARRAETLAVGYHPILRLPDDPRALELRTDFVRGHSGPRDSDVARTRHDSSFGRLDAIPAKSGDTIDMVHLPIDEPVEELLLLGRVDGPVVARYHDTAYDLILDWDRAILPNCLIWYHDRAEVTPPWNGRFRGLGLEPCASAFDFSAATSNGDNPLTAAGERTAINLSPVAPTTIRLSLAVEAFA
jgi:hypothetical protein